MVFALLHHPFVSKTIIVRSFTKKNFFSSLLWPLLTSCNSAVHHCTVWAGVNLSVLRPIARPPQLRTVTFLSYICHIYTAEFGQYWTLLCLASSSAPHMPYMWFLFVRPRVCFRLTSYSTSRWTHLPLANSSYCQACSGLTPPSYCPFWANYKKRLYIP